MRERDMFIEALHRETPEEREAYIASACAGDQELRQSVEKLLAEHHRQETFFLDKPPPGIQKQGAQPSVSETPGTQIGAYKLLQQIGEGGFGVVFMAEQTHPVRRKVALKILKPGMDTRQVLARFEAERQALAIMDHPNIARVFDGGATESGRPYFVMELVKGVSITEFCDGNHLAPRQRLELLLPVCAAVQHAHQKGIIHRDLKPANVLVSVHDTVPVIKVIDFGVAKALGQELTDKTLFTEFAQMIGTPLYMSPEQAGQSGLDVDTRSDIYSLGVLLYELLTGTTPFQKERFRKVAYDEIFRIIREEDPPRPSTRLSDSTDSLPTISAQRHTEPAKLTRLVRGELDWIVMKALEKDRNRRYETATGFAADIQHYLNDEPVQACPPSAAYRLSKFARRHQRALATTAVLALSLFIVAGTLGWAVRDREANAREAARQRAARQTAIELEVNLALNEAERWQKLGKWPEALTATRRAEGVLAGSGSGELRDRVRRMRKDLEMVLWLEEIPLLRSEVKDNRYDHEAADQAYAQAFADYGIDVMRLPAEVAGAQIRERGKVAIALAGALDDWAYCKAFKGKAGFLALTAVAQAADPDPWRRQVREAHRHKDRKALAALAASPELSRQPPATVITLAWAMRRVDLDPVRVEMLRRAQQQYPGDFWINVGLAEALVPMGDSFRDEVVAFRRAALAVRPKSVALHNDLGTALTDQGKVDEGIASYRKAIELGPESSHAYHNLGLALKAQGKLDEAVAYFRNVTKRHPTFASGYRNLARALTDRKQFPEAVAVAEMAIQLEPNNARGYTYLGHALSGQGKLPEAVAAHRSAVAHDTKNAIAYEHLGAALAEQRRLPEAVAAHQTAIDLDPNSVTAHNNLGTALYYQGKLPEAIAAYQQAIKLGSKDAAAYSNLALALVELNDPNKLPEALTAVEQAIEINPRFAGAHNVLGIVLSTQEKLDAAAAAYQSAIDLDSNFGNAHCNLGGVFGRQRKYDQAIACSRRALEINRKNDKARDILGVALHYWGWELVKNPDPKLRDPERAVAASQEAVELTPQATQAWQNLGWVQYRAGNWKASIEALETSCKLQDGGTGDAGQWIVIALGHARLALQEGLPETEREHHRTEARRRYAQADKQIDGWWPIRPDHEMGQSIWDFRLEVRELIAAMEPAK